MCKRAKYLSSNPEEIAEIINKVLKENPKQKTINWEIELGYPKEEIIKVVSLVNANASRIDIIPTTDSIIIKFHFKRKRKLSLKRKKKNTKKGDME